MDALIKHGYDSLPYELEAAQIKLRSDDLDQLSWSWAAPTKTSFLKGQPAPAPWQHFIIQDIDLEPDADEWIFRLSCEGIEQMRSRRVKGGYEETGAIGEWDTYRDRWISAIKGHFVRGQRVGNFVCIRANDVEKHSGFAMWECTGEFAGLKQRMPPRRVCTSNGQIISSDQLKVELEQGWTELRKGQASLPKLVITDTQHDWAPPPTSAVPGIRTPPNTPAIRNIVFTGSEVREVWPPGWGFTCGFEQPFGIDIPLYINTYTYEWSNKYLPA